MPAEEGARVRKGAHLLLVKYEEGFDCLGKDRRRIEFPCLEERRKNLLGRHFFEARIRARVVARKNILRGLAEIKTDRAKYG
jgi:hypothetical protein